MNYKNRKYASKLTVVLDMLMLHSEQHCQITNFTFSYVFEYWTGNNGMMHKKMTKNCEMVTWRQIGWCVHWLTHVFAVGKV